MWQDYFSLCEFKEQQGCDSAHYSLLGQQGDTQKTKLKLTLYTSVYKTVHLIAIALLDMIVVLFREACRTQRIFQGNMRVVH